MSLLKEIAKDVYVSKNKIDVSYFIKLIEESSKAYPFTEVDRKPHLTMTLPLNFNVEDTSACINLRYEVYKMIMPVVIEHMNKNNLEHMYNKRQVMLVSKLLPHKAMLPHVDNKNKDSNHFICMVYINSNFDGGELHFNDLDLTYTPSDGDVVLFRASLLHEVFPVKNGIRYSVSYGITDDENY
jgi:hypothetical protein